MARQDLARSPTIVGTGLVALDVVWTLGDPRPTHYAAGGTCANVLANLAALGWTTTPLARLAEDRAGRLVRSDLARAGVRTDHLGLPTRKPTPIVVQLNDLAPEGCSTHRFIWRCPTCGRRLPRHSPVTNAVLAELTPTLPPPDVFFFDRPSPAAVRLAKVFASHGTLVVFEPSAGGGNPHFRDALAIADILKYSADRFPTLRLPAARERRLLLEVQTLGARGARYRSWAPDHEPRWTRVPAFDVTRVVDTAGCGDWTTAGIIYELGPIGRPQLASLSEQEIRQAIRHGQALAAWSLGFAGARGGNSSQTDAARRAAVDYILREGRQPRARVSGSRTSTRSRGNVVCSQCPAEPAL